jgi:NADH-quinone oxidoreductase subunit G
MISLKINHIPFIVKEGISILEACKFVGIKIPRFCYHDTLSIAGNCRMCLIKMEADDKLLISCLTRVAPEMEIMSEDPTITKAREEIIEFLLIDHPLDCPICDQGGECDLQDQTKLFGSDRTKYSFNKAVVEDKNFSVFIKTIMTRCIHCTRCVRFASEITGLDFFGVINRGNNMEISTYNNDFFKSEISGNVIDLCPVGALTSKPYTFRARPWELKSVESIDVTDSTGSNIYINFTESGVSRILPKYNVQINENIITDKSRFFYDSFSSYNSLIKPLKLNEKKSIVLNNLDFEVKQLNLKDKKTLVLLSENSKFEDINITKNYFGDYKVKSYSVEARLRKNYFFNINNRIQKIKNSNGFCFLIATNPRTEAALINSKLRFLTLNNFFKIYEFGFKYDSVVSNTFVNLNIACLLKSLEGKAANLSFILINCVNGLIIVGSSLIFRGFNVDNLRHYIKNINPSLNFLNILASSNSSAFEYMNIPSINRSSYLKSDVVVYVSCRENNFIKKYFLSQNKIVFWLNTHKLNYSKQNTIQIPIKTVFEENGTYVNLEFRPQLSQKFLSSKINTKSSLDLLSKYLNLKLVKNGYNNFFKEILEYPNKFSSFLIKTHLADIQNRVLSNLQTLKIQKYPIKAIYNDFFQTNHYTDYSKNMCLASQENQKRNNNFF